MKSIKLFVLLIGLSMMIWWACSNRETSPTAPKQSACVVQPHGLNKPFGDHSYAQFEFVGDPDGPQPASFNMTRFEPSADPQGPQPANKTMWYGDCDDRIIPGTPDTWHAWNCTIDRSDLADNCLYTEVGNESYPTTCKEMTIDADLYWRPYPYTGKLKKYAYIRNWKVYDQSVQVVSGAFVWRDAWESKCIAYHTCWDDTNEPDSASVQTRSRFGTLSPQSAVKK